MSKSAAISLAVVALLAGLAVGAIPARSQTGNRTTIVALDLNRDDRIMDVDVNREGFGKGDSFGFTSPLLDPEDRSKIGSLKAVCTVLNASRENNTATQLCDAEAIFEGGKLTIHGSVRFSDSNESSTLVITGGTSMFEGAAGTAVIEFRRRSALMTFDFTTNA